MSTLLQFYIAAIVFGYLLGITFGQIGFRAQDCWIGLYWKTETLTWDAYRGRRKITTFYFCLIPCFPIILEHHKLT